MRILLRRRVNRSAGETGNETGSATVWVVACAVLVLFVGLTVVLRESATLARHRAQGAADLAVLAAAGQFGVSDRICAAAAVSATANGARLVTCSPQPSPSGRSGTVDVVVSVPVRLPLLGARSAVARARAGRDPPQAAAPRQIAGGSVSDGPVSVAWMPTSVGSASNGGTTGCGPGR